MGKPWPNETWEDYRKRKIREREERRKERRVLKAAKALGFEK